MLLKLRFELRIQCNDAQQVQARYAPNVAPLLRELGECTCVSIAKRYKKR